MCVVSSSNRHTVRTPLRKLHAMGSPSFDELDALEPVVVTPSKMSKRARRGAKEAAELAAEVDPRGAVEVNPHVEPLYQAADYMVVKGGYAGETPTVVQLTNVNNTR